MDMISNSKPDINNGLNPGDNATAMPSIENVPRAPYIKAIPISISPVEKDPIRKYFSEASLLLRFLLSLPVKIYKGMDIISIPRNNISRVLKEDAKLTPQRTKNIRAKYSAALVPTFSISLPERQKYNNVQANAIELNTSVKLLKRSMLFALNENSRIPYSSPMFTASSRIIPAIAIILTVELFLKKIPLNIIATPIIADTIIAFIIN